MNLLGKIFVVLILVMSLVFMSFAMVVYSTQKNWRQEAVTQKKAADTRQAENVRLKDEKERFEKERDAERTAKVQAVAKLENELKVRKDELAALEAKQADLEKAHREAVAGMAAAQTNSTNYRKELDAQRTALEEARKDRDAHFKEVVRVTDQLHQTQNENDLFEKRTQELGDSLAKSRVVLRKFKLDENRNYSEVPPIVDGIITSTPGNGLVEISIGADQGLLKGHKLEVYRTGGGHSQYVGRVEVVQTSADKAVCKIDPKYQNSNMMVDDRVASKIEQDQEREDAGQGCGAHSGSGISTGARAGARAKYPGPRADFYTVLLVIALVALLVGIVLLYVETRDLAMRTDRFHGEGAPAVAIVDAPDLPLSAAIWMRRGRILRVDT